MSKYTITIKNLIDNNFKFNLDNYPIFNEDYRPTLNKKILNHYYMNEIGFETAELFNFYLNTTMNEIMPYYNELYKAQTQILDNLFDNINITEIFNKNLTEDNVQKLTNISNANSSSNSNTSNNTKDLFQNTPQGKITMGELEEQNWATSVEFNNTNSNSQISDNSNSNNTSDLNNNKKADENYTKTIKGSQGKYNIDILNDIKAKLLNIDMMIINDLQDLFFGLM